MRRRRGLLVALAAIALVVASMILRGCDHRVECMSRLFDVGKILRETPADERNEVMKNRGAGMLIALHRTGRMSENLMRCPDDPDLRPFDDAAAKAYDEVDLSDPPDDLVSYAVRDFERFPLPTGGSVIHEPIACCRCGRDGRTPHHRGGGVVVLFAEGDVQWLTRDELGRDPVVVGPESKNTLLRMMIQRAPR